MIQKGQKGGEVVPIWKRQRWLLNFADFGLKKGVTTESQASVYLLQVSLRILRKELSVQTRVTGLNKAFDVNFFINMKVSIALVPYFGFTKNLRRA